MSESKAKRAALQDGPYRRIAILAGILIAVVVVFFAVNVLARGFGGNERRLAEVLTASLNEPRIHAKFDLSRQAQTNSFGVKGEVDSEKLKAISADLTVSAAAQSQQLKLPVKVYAALGKDSKFFIKGTNLNTLADMIGQSTPQINADIVSISRKLEGKWLLIPQSKASTGSCVSSLLEKMQSDKDTAKEFGKLYLKNRFISVDSIEQKSATAEEFTVTYKHEAMTSFVNDLKKQDFYKSIKSCTDDLQIPGVNTQTAQTPGASEPETTTKIFAENGKVTSINSSTALDGRVDTFSAAVDYKKGKQLAAPTRDIVKIDSLKSEITSVSRFIMQQQMAAASQQAQ